MKNPNRNVNTAKGKIIQDAVSLKTAYATQKKEKNRKRNVAVVFCAVVLLVCAYLCYSKLMLIKTCKVEGQVPYTNDEVLLGAGLDYGMHMYEKELEQIEENVKYNLPYVDSFEIKRRFPSTIVFEVVQAKPSMYTVISNQMFVLSQSLRVLSDTDDINYIEENKLLFVEFGEITKCVVGEYIVADKDAMEITKTIYRSFEEMGMLSNVSELDISDRFDINFNYKSSYTVKLGDSNNLNQKIKFMNAIAEQLTGASSGIIDVSDENVKEGIVKNY